MPKLCTTSISITVKLVLKSWGQLVYNRRLVLVQPASLFTYEPALPDSTVHKYLQLRTACHLLVRIQKHSLFIKNSSVKLHVMPIIHSTNKDETKSFIPNLLFIRSSLV
jgi:hypothetical protein